VEEVRQDGKRGRTMNAFSRFSAVMVIASCSFGCNKTAEQAGNAVPKQDTESELRHKLECEKLRKDVVDNLDQNQFEIQNLYSVFYSSKMNSCLAAKYTLYPRKNAASSETLEIDDLLDQRQVWSQYLEESKQYPVVEDMLDKQIDSLK
jgi:hypothetical protein